MKKNKFILVFAFFAMFLSACSTAKVSKVDNKQNILDPTIKVGHLENGMNYYIKENAEPKNRIELRLVVKAGSCMEEDDQKGIAHFVEHMCYNGTKNFEKSAIVDYFESLGMEFGPEVNAATSFENTTYFIQVPADNLEYLKKGLLVLHDWASEVTFDQDELDKERGVIVEEWRIRKLGLNGRVLDSEINYMLANSRYAERLPIGDINIIKTISRDRVVDFYKKWYRPEFMSVVVVGDLKSEQIEKEIQEIMGSIEQSKENIKHPEFDVPVRKEKSIEIIKDDEAKYNEIIFLKQRTDNVVIKNKEDTKKLITASIGETALNQRLNEITTTADCKWLSASCGTMGFTNTTSFKNLYLIPKEGMEKEAMKSFLDEVDRFTSYGVTDEELLRIKNAILNNYEQALLNLDKIASGAYCNDIVSSYLTGCRYMSPKDTYAEAKEVLNEITTEDINSVFNEYFENRGNMCYILSPGKKNNLPSEEEILDIWKNYKNDSIEKYENASLNDLLMDRPSDKAKIINKKKNKSLGVTEYDLENGVKIITKKTDNNKDSVLFYAGSKGGYFKIDEKDVPSMEVCIDYAMYSGINDIPFAQILKQMQDKNIDFGANIYNATECIYGSSNNENLEYLMQVIYQAFNKTNFSDDSWKMIMDSISQQANAFGTRPEDIYNKTINEIRYGKTNYHTVIDNNFVSQMNKEKSEKAFKDRYDNPADFTFIFVGDINEKKLLELCCSYLGTLKTTDKREETEYKYFPFPEGINKATVKKGMDKQGKVYISMGGNLPAADNVDQAYKDASLLDNLLYYLEIRLREIIREDKSGSYGVNVNGYIDGYPERYYEISVNFGCEPEREEELVEAVLDEFKRIKAGEIAEENIMKIKENIIRGNENREKNNWWWRNVINSVLVFNSEPEWISQPDALNKIADWVTLDNLTETANKYLDTNNYINVNLVPEK